MLLLMIGLVLGMATSPALADRTGVADSFLYVRRHLAYGAVGLCVMAGASTLSPLWLRRIGVVAFFVFFALLLLLPVMGETHGGATRWLSIAGISLQPSELLKPGLICICAWMFSIRDEPGAPPGVLLAAIIMGVVASLLVMQPDYGQMALMSATWAAMFFLAGASMVWAATGAAVAALGGVAAYLSSSHFARRVDMFFSPENAGSQIRATWAAIQNGGMWGRGPGEGVVKSSLPDAHSDFVIAVAAEEYGLALTLAIIALFAFISIRTLIRVMDEDDAFTRLAASGFAALLTIQAFVHIGVSARVLPTKGMTLPFIAYGGSSLVASCLIFGFLLALTRRRPPLASGEQA